jgi:hypothetical protein
VEEEEEETRTSYIIYYLYANTIFRRMIARTVGLSVMWRRRRRGHELQKQRVRWLFQRRSTKGISYTRALSSLLLAARPTGG